MTVQDLEHVDWRHTDKFTGTTLVVEGYPYGAGRPGAGLQISLKREGGQILVVRLPYPVLGDLLNEVMSKALAPPPGGWPTL